MLEDLKRINSLGNKNGIFWFVNMVFQSNGVSKSALFVGPTYQSDISINVDASIVFFETIGLICVNNRNVYPSKEALSLGNPQEGDFWDKLADCVIQFCLANQIIVSSAYRFDVNKGLFYIASFGFPLQYSLFRNLLIQLGALNEGDNGNLYIPLSFETVFSKGNAETRIRVTLDELKERLKRQELQGEQGEQFALHYELARLGKMGFIPGAYPKRISIFDASAGYDIVSYMKPSSTGFDRFIEVKTYLGKPHFYWSSNEIEKAKALGDHYFLYLVDYEKIDSLNYEPEIIRNPFSTIFGGNDWVANPDTFAVEKLI